jgi:DNA-binding FadR family transcriptional regulator
MNSWDSQTGSRATQLKEHSNPMTNNAEDLQRLTEDMLKCVSALEAVLGDSVAVRRIANDVQRISNGVDRLEIDLAELGELRAMNCPQPVQMIQISDADYDLDFWRDVDHEGLGAQSLVRGKRSR